jgi:hypothetical protein
MASHHAVTEKIEEENHNANRAAPGVGEACKGIKH